MTASIQGNWHLYSQNAGEGPEPTSFIFTKNPLVKVEGKVVEVGKMESMYDPNFKSTLKFYNGTVDFVQKINLKSSASTVVKGSVTFMVCNDRRCLPPKEIPFTIKVDGK
jgi:thiol:disulfide interchange protein DsbD